MMIRDVMNIDVSCCLPMDSAMRAARLMRDKQVPLLPVVDSLERRRVIGIVTDRDLCVGVVGEGLIPSSVRIKYVMTPDVVSCSPQDDEHHVLRLMHTRQVRRLPVVDGTGTLVGIVTREQLHSAPDRANEAPRSGTVTHPEQMVG